MGLDVEWRPHSPRLALLQLAEPGGSVMLVHLCHLSGPLPHALLSVLSSNRVIKTGVGIAEDAHKLYKHFGAVVGGVMDLCQLRAFQLKRNPNLAMLGGPVTPGLASYAFYYAGIPTWKDKRIAASDWETFPLAPDQLMYAAMDAWAAAVTYCGMVSRRPQRWMPPARPALLAVKTSK